MEKAYMDTKLLNAANWKSTALKLKLPKLRENERLQQELSNFEKLPEEKCADRLKAVSLVMQSVLALKKAKEIAALRDVLKYLTEMASAAQALQRELSQAKVAAEKAEALAAKTEALKKKADGDAKKDKQEEEEGTEEEEEEEEGEAHKKLITALKSLKVSKKPYYFLVCDAKPYGLIVSRKDIRKSAQARKELAKIAGGSTRPPKFGECRCESGKYFFEMEKPPSGLARILQKWIKQCTGLGLKIVVGTESAEDEEGPSEAAQTQVAEQKPAASDATSKAAAEKEVEVLEDRRRAFKKARATWVAVKNRAEEDLEKVKDGIQLAYIADTKQFPKVVQGCKEIDAILDGLDDELRDTLDQYASTPIQNQARLHSLAAKATEILDRYHSYVANNSLMKAIDMKEFADVTVHAPVMKALGDLRKTLL
jgi:hypothetical protein